MSDVSNSLYFRSLNFLEGKNVEKDEAQSFILNAEAAKTGHHDAVLAMGWFYLNGFGVEKDLALAQKWYRKSARTGDTRAMFSLGVIACQQRDYFDAHKWFGRAVASGHFRSLCWLAKLRWRGHGVPQSRSKP